MTERHGYYMRTFTGRKYWPLDPREEDIEIIDIAHSLAHQCRFGGHTQQFYSVAEHSVHCAGQEQNDPQLALELLLHDAAEGYVSDMIRPIKMVDEFRSVFVPIETKNEIVIAKKFGLRFPFHPRIKDVDMRICQAELNQAMHGVEGNSLRLMEGDYEPADIKIQFWSPSYAKTQFLNCFYVLSQAVSNK